MSRGEKPGCLVVCSGHQNGVSAQSFIHTFTLTSSAFNVFLATPGGVPVEFSDIDDSNRQWVVDFRSRALSPPNSLEKVDTSQFVALVLPSAPGAPHDLSTSQELGILLNSFTREQKPICAIGFGVTGLFSSLDLHTQQWNFKDYSMTGPSLAEVAKRDDFATLPVLAPDFIRKHGGSYSAGRPGGLHVVVDSNLVTGQNEQSTLTAVQNLILLSNARLTRTR